MQEKKGDKYEPMKPKGGHELLLVVSWYEGFLACNNEGSPNQVTFMLMSKKILITRWEEVWKSKPQFLYSAADFEVCDQSVPGTFFSWRPQVLVQALPQQGERGQTGCWSGKGRRPFCNRCCLCKCSFDTRLPGLRKNCPLVFVFVIIDLSKGTSHSRCIWVSRFEAWRVWLVNFKEFCIKSSATYYINLLQEFVFNICCDRCLALCPFSSWFSSPSLQDQSSRSKTEIPGDFELAQYFWWDDHMIKGDDGNF